METGAIHSRSRLRSLVGLAVGCALAASVAAAPTLAGATARRAASATGTVTDVANPDVYTCGEPGWIGFEDLANNTPLGASTIDGVSFSTSGGNPWTVGDYAVGTYDGKFPAGQYTSEELHWAWPGDDNGSGRIDLTGGPASKFSLLVSTTDPVSLDAFSSDDTLLATAGPTPVQAHTNGVRHMSGMQIVSDVADISYVVIHGDPGVSFAVDSICTDAPEVPTAQVNLAAQGAQDAADGHPLSTTTVNGTGFRPGEEIDLSLDGVFLGARKANKAGGFSRSVKVPGDAQPGEHTIVATGVTSGASNTANYLVRSDWKQYGYSPTRAALNKYEDTIDADNVDSLVPQWKGLTGARTTGPAVTNGVAYAGSQDGAIYAFNVATGDAIWSKATGGPIGSTPAVDDGLVFTGSGDKKVWAIDAGTGAKVWTYTTGGGISKSPLVRGGIVYIGSDDGTMYALKETTGALVWKQHVGGRIRSSPATDGQRIFFGSDDHELHALDLKTGAPDWASNDTGFVIRSNPSVVGGHVFVGGDDGFVYAFRTTTGVMTWNTLLGEQVRSSPALYNGVVYIGSNDGFVYALSEATGAIVWHTDTTGSVNVEPAIANGIVYAGSANGLVALDAMHGTILTTKTVDSTIISPPSVSDGAVYVGSGDHHEYKFTLPVDRPLTSLR